jgi:hypothetical protein
VKSFFEVLGAAGPAGPAEAQTVVRHATRQLRRSPDLSRHLHSRSNPARC